MLFMTGVLTRSAWRDLDNRKMKIKYFPDTDTALLEFYEGPIAETKELSEDILVDVDKQGQVVSMTIEHARERARFPDLHFQEMPESRQGS